MPKSYKITSADERHYGMQYHDGLVEDVLPFNPSGNCEPGGIYFASDDILAFIHHGPWIREVTLPDGESVYENPGTPKKFKVHRVILGKRRQWSDPQVFAKLLKDGVDPAADDNYAIRWASANGHTAVVKLLLADKRVDPSACDNYAICWAAEYGHTAVVKLLLADQRVDPSAGDNSAIRRASEYGHAAVVKLLLADPRVDPAADNNYAIRWASYNGHAAVVKLLLADPRVDPSADDNCAIRWASRNGHTEVVELLKQHGCGM